VNIVSAVVGSAIVAGLAPGVMQMSIQPLLAGKRAANFSAAEAMAVTYAAQSEKASELQELNDACTLDSTDEPAYTVTCTVGSGQFKQTISRSFRLEINGRNGLEVTTDDDRDGFDDTTGMLTHYAECYSGWKGLEGQTLKNNCELGGPYVIPAYRHLYEE
jgi:hypothetical protein